MVKRLIYLFIIKGILFLNIFCNTNFDCQANMDLHNDLDFNGEIKYLWFNGRNYKLKIQDLKTNQIRTYPYESIEIYSNAEMFKVGDTILKNKGQLYYIIKNKDKKIKIPVFCSPETGDKRSRID